MKITWIGHASFLIETAGKRIITDPFDEETGYTPPGLSADMVTISHRHYDHAAVETVEGDPVVVEAPGSHVFGEIEITGVSTFHDKTGGRSRGKNTVFVIKSEGLTVCHLGDLGHIPTPAQAEAIGRIGILLIPVGGNYTINASEAMETVRLLNPRVVVPMHFKTPVVNISLAPVEEFTKKYDKVVKLPFLEISQARIESCPPIILLDYLRP